MHSREKEAIKADFRRKLSAFVSSLKGHVSTQDDQWTIKGFIDVFRNIYTISTDTKVVSKILEIHLFPKLLEFAATNGYKIVLTEEQNHYPDLSFIGADDARAKFAVDLKTTYRLPDNPEFCNGFTLGSHGEYFVNRASTKNIRFPYNEYWGHFCLGIIYSRSISEKEDETKTFQLDALQSIVSVVRDFQFFVREKWEIASDRQGSHNTANIGSVVKINDILNGNGVFKHLGEKWFDDYWMNYGKITITTPDGKTKALSKNNSRFSAPDTESKLGSYFFMIPKQVTKLHEFLVYRGQDPGLANPMLNKPSRRRSKSEANRE